MALDPWSYAEKTGKEHAHQAALFMWANMAQRFGIRAAEQVASYTTPGHAKAWHNQNVTSGCVDTAPELKWLHAIHNQGHGDAIRGAKAKAEGVKPGVYDMFLPMPMPKQETETYFGQGPFVLNYCGLYLELKVGKNKPSEKQNEFSKDMRKAGYATAVAWGWLEARKIILDYLGQSL
jgi:hypothetical protein